MLITKWYSVFFLVFFLITAVSFLTIYIELDPRLCFSRQCWENMLVYFEFPLKAGAASLAILTITLAYYRTGQIDQQLQGQQSQIDLQNRQMRLQEKQINQIADSQLKEEYVTTFKQINQDLKTSRFYDKENFRRMFPQSINGNRELNQLVSSLMETSIVVSIGEMYNVLLSQKLTKYYCESYEDTIQAMSLLSGLVHIQYSTPQLMLLKHPKEAQ